jgi:hypothetical protein
MFKRLLLIGNGLLVVAAALLVVPQIKPMTVLAKQPLVLDIAIDGRTFRLDNPVPPNPFNPFSPANIGLIKRGNTFIVTGKIYPGGTIPAGGSFGSPVFSPDTPGSIGTWICRGTFALDGTDILAGSLPMVYTTQIFQLSTGSIWSDGAEGGPNVRAVTGGTGSYSGASGDVSQIDLGVNSAGTSQDFNLRESFTLHEKS